MNGDARRRGLLQRRADALDLDVRRESGLSRWIDLGKGRVSVLGHVRIRTGREVRARTRPGIDGSASFDRGGYALPLRHVPARAVHGDERRLLAAAKRLQRSLVRLIGGIAGDRERLEPAVRESRGAEEPEEQEGYPGDDDPAPAPDDEMGEP